MDIAAFVGFATRGPIDVPVPVEDVGRFRDVFGPPLELVQDRETGRTKRAQLSRAVEAFFRNGGRRCWVVRVAQPANEGSSTHPVGRTSFGLPGLVSANTGRPSTVRARSYGATFDELRVGTLLHRRVLPVPSTVERIGDDAASRPLSLSWETSRRDSLVGDELTVGSLLRLSMEDGLVAFAPVTSQRRIVTKEGSDSNTSSLEVQTAPVRFFRHDPMPLREPVESSVTETEDGAEVNVSVEVQGATGASEPSYDDATIRRAVGGEDQPVFLLLVDEESGEAAFDLEHQVVHVRGLDGALEGWLQLGHAGHPSASRVEMEVRDALWPVDSEAVFGEASLPPVEGIERQRFDLLVWKGQELQTRLEGLGFVESHPRAWTDLPVDEDLFALQEGEAVSPEPGTLRADVFDPRFQLAGPESPGPGPFIPLGMADRPDAERTHGSIPTSVEHTRLEKERLATFSTDMFVESKLAGTSTANLAEKADDMIFVDEEPASGVHSLWPIQEVTLLAAPDAVHYGWEKPEAVSPTPASTPVLEELEAHGEAAPPYVRVSWTVDRLDEEEIEVEVQEATEPTFEHPVFRYRGSKPSVDRYIHDENPVSLFFRYRIVDSGQPGAWSNTRHATLPEPDFDPCAARPGVPIVTSIGNRWLAWKPLPEPSDGSLTYELQCDRTPTFDAPSEVSFNVLPPEDTPPNLETLGWYRPSDLDLSCWYKVPFSRETPSVQYVRLRARREIDDRTLVGAWSNTVAFVRDLEQRKSFIAKQEYDDPTSDSAAGRREGLLHLQRAMLRFSAARGDVLSVCALPERDEPEDARRHVGRLRTLGAALDYDEERTLSYGALYYPWFLGPVDDGDRIAPAPPDGAACGMIADRTLRDGAWMAPANQSLADVQAVVPPLAPDDLTGLEASSMNVFTDTPDGILTLGTKTLAHTPDLEPITTRRLLILVRRLAQREGPALVFENNTSLLRRRIAEQFDDVLRRLFDRGAFAGATPSEGYRIVVDESVNPPRQMERGRLVVELRIAPSRPLKFLTVRLVQRSGQRPAIPRSAAGAPP